MALVNRSRIQANKQKLIKEGKKRRIQISDFETWNNVGKQKKKIIKQIHIEVFKKRGG